MRRPSLLPAASAISEPSSAPSSDMLTTRPDWKGVSPYLGAARAGASAWLASSSWLWRWLAGGGGCV